MIKLIVVIVYIITFINKMKRQFSFKGCSRVASPHDIENLPPKQSQYGSNKFSRNAWTDMRVEEIKKKYDTPSHKRKNGSSFGAHDFPKQYRLSLQRNDSQNFNSTKSKPLRQIKNMNQVREGNLESENFISRRQENVQKYNIEENEKTVFDKIEQMKNCLLNEKREKESYEVSEFKNYKESPQVQVNPRVANIDKINDKIKKILDCLYENDKYIKNQRAEIKGSFLENDKFQHTQVLSRQKIQQQNQYSSKLDTYCLKKSEYQKKQEDSDAQLQNFYRETNSPNVFYDQESSWFRNSSIEKMRSRSCLNSFDKEEQKLKGGKKIDDQISKITTRIKQFEEEKKKLNIQFKPFHLEIRGSKSAAKLLPQKSQRNEKPPLPIKSRLFQCSGAKHNRSNTDFKNRFLTEFDVSKDNETSEQYPTMLTDKSTHSMHQSKTISMKSSLIGFSEIKNEEYKEDQTMKEIEQLRKKTGEGMENRKKLLQTTTVTFATETKRLIQSLFEQVKLDEGFRNAKIWFRDAMIQNRWQKLKELLQKKGESKDEDELKKEYHVCEDEDNPFFSVRDCQNTIEDLLESEKRAEKHWEKQIVHKFNREQFMEEKFTCEKIDLEKKGYFVLEDLVRFINMETGTFYRNRDLYLAFRRLTKSDKMNFQRFMDVLVDDLV